MSRRLDELHVDWLSLVEPEGQFLTLPVLQRAFPNGLDNVRASVRADLRKHYPQDTEPTTEQWKAWIDLLLRDVLAWGPYYRTGNDVSAYVLDVPEHTTTLRAHGALCDPQAGGPRVLVMTFPHGTVLDKRQPGERWNASPIERLKELCKAHGVRIGMVTDGERIVVAWVPDIAGGYATWPTALFLESRERGLLQSFTSLLSASRFFAVREDVQIEGLFEASEKAQNEVTNQLGYQIRQAVELLVNSVSRANLERDGKLLATVAPQTVYEAAVTVMMRLVFLLYAEERELLPLSEPIYAEFYAASTLRKQLDEQATLEGDEPLERRSSAWNRLLAAFRVIYGGLNHDRLRMVAHGGRLFDPDRFPFLEGRTDRQKWHDSKCNPLPVDDLTVRAIMEAIQTLPIREGGSSERRRLSFRSLDVEQIGHVYEGLLDHGAVQVDDVYVGLIGKTGDEAEVPLSDIEAAAKKGDGALSAFLAEKTRRSEAAIAKMLKEGQMLIQGKDQEMRRLLNTVCDNNASLSARIAPFVYMLRSDLRGLPVVFPPGSLVVKQTSARRDSGTEYTPRELADEIVKYTLEPLVYSPGAQDGIEPGQWRLRSSAEILELKVCDPAVGSGAFLVSACRYLADRIVEAWVTENPMCENLNREELTLDARRAVVDRCLYGVDRDPIAVEMAKLSLWLTTMQRGRPFSFLDHSVREGDSLLGLTSLEQIYNIHLDPVAGKSLHSGSLFDAASVIRPVVERATALRRDLETLPNSTYRDAEAKERLNDEANVLLDTVSVASDAIVAAALSTATQGDKQRSAAFQEVALHLRLALDPSIPDEKRVATIASMRTASKQKINAGRPDGATRTTLHWAIVFPEVFERKLNGFDAVVGNPPFVGGTMISGLLGDDYREFLTRDIAGVKRSGRADLVGFFILRSIQIARRCGLLACDSIAEGDTRQLVLDRLATFDKRISRAVKSVPWPGKAGADISKLWIVPLESREPNILSGHNVDAISASLTPASHHVDPPAQLKSQPCFASKGSDIVGEGFVLSEDVANQMLRIKDNAKVVMPYLGGSDVCDSYSLEPSRYIINFFDWSETAAERFQAPFNHVLAEVKPERQRRDENCDYVLSSPLPQLWWRYNRQRKKLYSTLRGLDMAIVLPRTSKYMMPVTVPTSRVFADGLFVVASDDFSLFSILSSDVHRAWVLTWGGTMSTRIRYNPNHCFVTFPFPALLSGNLGIAGRGLAKFRATVMNDLHLGITDIYNRVHDPDDDERAIVELRELHAEIDRQSVLSYGWDDINCAHSFIDTPQGLRYMMDDAARGKCLDRLLELNHEQHRRDVSLGHAGDSRGAATGKPKRSKKAALVPDEVQAMPMDTHV